MMKRLEHVFCEEGLRELGQRRLRWDFIRVWKYLQGGCKEDRARLSSQCLDQRKWHTQEALSGDRVDGLA